MPATGEGDDIEVLGEQAARERVAHPPRNMRVAERIGLCPEMRQIISAAAARVGWDEPTDRGRYRQMAKRGTERPVVEERPQV